MLGVSDQISCISMQLARRYLYLSRACLVCAWSAQTTVPIMSGAGGAAGGGGGGGGGGGRGGGGGGGGFRALTFLDASHNHLLQLGCALPAALTHLDLSHNGLIVLPDEPYEFTVDDGPEYFSAHAALISGRLLTWYGPAMVAAPAELAWAIDAWLGPLLTAGERAEVEGARRAAVERLFASAAMTDPDVARVVGLPTLTEARRLLHGMVSRVWEPAARAA